MNERQLAEIADKVCLGHRLWIRFAVEHINRLVVYSCLQLLNDGDKSRYQISVDPDGY